MKENFGKLTFKINPKLIVIYSFIISQTIIIPQNHVISSIFLRAYRICSFQYLDKEILNIFKCLKYLEWFIKKAHLKARKTFYSESKVHPLKYVSVPYINSLEKVRDYAK